MHAYLDENTQHHIIAAVRGALTGIGQPADCTFVAGQAQREDVRKLILLMRRRWYSSLALHREHLPFSFNGCEEAPAT